MALPAPDRLDRQETQQAEARPVGRPPSRKLPPGIVEPKRPAAPAAEPARPLEPVQAARRSAGLEDYQDYTEIEPQHAETAWPVFDAMVVYLGNHPKKSVSLPGYVMTEHFEQPDGAVAKVNSVVPSNGAQVYEFWTLDTLGRRMATYEPDVCGCTHGLSEHDVSPCRGTVIRKKGQLPEPCECTKFSARGRLIPLSWRDEAIRGRPFQIVQHPLHLREFFAAREGGQRAFKVLIKPGERQQWLEWLMRFNRAKKQETGFQVETQQEDGSSSHYIHANETRVNAG